MRYKPSLSLFTWVIGIMLALLLAACLGFYLMIRDVKDTIQKKFDKPISTHITKYDTVTEAKLEKISADAETDYKRIDNMLPDELQSALDSIFNRRQP
jgi:hypothetical protein